MSSGTTTVSQQEPQAFKRAVKKIKCAAMVANLAKSWQGWANDHSGKQDAIPSGWMPSSVEEDCENAQKHVVKLNVTPRVIAVDANDPSGSGIRTCSVTKTVQPKRSECSSSDVLNAIKGKMESGEEETKPFLGNESPTRRRQMRALQSGVVQDRKSMLVDRKSGLWRSNSVDTEDSGLGEEESEIRADNEILKKLTRPKIKISSMVDIKSRWQQWSVQHVEGQKLNPFSEEFDQEYAMAQRLKKGDSGYGRPKEGSKTAQRGDRAHKHIHREMEEMVWIIKDMGFKDKEGRTIISFGRLFDRYVKISDKVVGILLRCRKHKMLDFEGEMLWKGQDDDVMIILREEEGV
ncbi:actin-binding Rho-activating protein [Eucyclogobius newberryi]|uniref:actin-binding Rho-activating protein n=1 Tax=Eucyclogobius newberryi TaxID=166745 RepID=UPI003B5A0F1D